MSIGSIAMSAAARWKTGGIIVNEHTLTRDATRLHVDFLGRHFDFIHLDELPHRLSHPRRRPFCLLTFDDGKRSNATVTAPELDRLGVPAVFFVVTDFLGSNKPLWFDRYFSLRAKLGEMPPGLSGRVIKQLPHDVLCERIEAACARHSVHTDTANEDVMAMTWDQARDLHKRGFTVGAHGATHAIMTRETKPAAFENIAASIARVGAEIGAPCKTFAFPNGNYTAELAQHALRCGVQEVMTTEPMWADRNFPLWRLPRIQLFGPQSRERIELKVAASATGRILANPDGTGKIYRAVHRLGKMSQKRTGTSAAPIDTKIKAKIRLDRRVKEI